MTKTPPPRPSLFRLAKACLFSPSEAAEAARAPGVVVPAAWIYAAFLLATAVFYANKPFDFPDRNAVFPRETQGFWFWLRVMAWQPPLEAGWILFLAALLEWFREGKLFPRLLGGVLATAAPLILLVVYKNGGMGRAAYMAGAGAWFVLMGYFARRARTEDWAPIATVMLALNVIGLLGLLPMAAAVALDSEGLYKGAQIVCGLWMLGGTALALRGVTGQRLPRCFMAVLLSMFMQIAFAFTLHMLGLVPKDILKALLYA